MMRRALRLEYQRAQLKAQKELGRVPENGEWEHHLHPCAAEELGIEVDPLEVLEASLVPCGC